jgi:hypothetical protein
MNPADAKLKCSQCGAEITNLTMSWGGSYWRTTLWFIPIALIPVGMISCFEWYRNRNDLDFVRDVQATLLEVRPAEDHVDVLGQLKNNGKHAWFRVDVEAEFSDESGKFLDEASHWSFSSTLLPGDEQRLKITLTTNDPRILKGKPNVVLKVTDGHLKQW